MMIINQPENELVSVQCYKCKSVFKMHPMSNLSGPCFTDCSLHDDSNDKREPDRPPHEGAGFYR